MIKCLFTYVLTLVLSRSFRTKPTYFCNIFFRETGTTHPFSINLPFSGPKMNMNVGKVKKFFSLVTTALDQSLRWKFVHPFQVQKLIIWGTRLRSRLVYILLRFFKITGLIFSFDKFQLEMKRLKQQKEHEIEDVEIEDSFSIDWNCWFLFRSSHIFIFWFLVFWSL